MTHIINAQLRVSPDLAHLRKTLSQLQSETERHKVGQNIYRPATEGAKRYRNELSYLNTSLEANSRRIAITARTLSTLTGQYIGLYSAYRLVGKGIREYIKYEDNLTAMRQITGATRAETKALSDDILRLGQIYGVASQSIFDTSVELLQSGQSISQVKGLIPTLAVLAKNSQVGAEGLKDVARATTVWREVFAKTSNDDIGLALGKSVQLAKAGLIEVDDLIESSTILGKVWADAGGSLDDMLSTLTAVKQASGRPAAEISRALNTILMRATRPASRKLLEEQGVQLYDNNQFVGVMEMVKRVQKLRESLGKGTPELKELDDALGGVYRTSIGRTLYENIEAIEKYKESVKSVVGVLEQDMSYAADNLSTKLTKLSETAKASAIGIGEGFSGDLLKNLTDTTTQLIKMKELLFGIGVVGAMALGKVGMKKMGGLGGNMLGIGGLYTGYLSANTPLNNNNNALNSSILTGLSTGLFALQLGINPVVAGFAGLSTATMALANNIEEVAKYRITQGMADTQSEVARNIQLGLASPEALSALSRQAQQYEQKSKIADELPHWLSSHMTWGENGGLGGLLPDPSINAMYQKEEMLRKGRRQAFLSEAQPVKATVAQYKQAFIDSGADISQYETWNNGVMKTIEVLDDLTDDLVGRNYSSRLKKVIEEEMRARKQIVENTEEMAESTGRAITEEVLEHIRNNISKTLTQNYGNVNSAFSSVMSDMAGVAGMRTNANTNDDVLRMVKNLVPHITQSKLFAQPEASLPRPNTPTSWNMRAGMSTSVMVQNGNLIQDLTNHLASLNITSENNRFGEMRAEVDRTRSALSLLADVGQRTASIMDETNKLQDIINNKGDYASYMLTASRSEQRNMDKGKMLAQQLFATGQPIDSLSLKNRKSVLDYTRLTGGFSDAVGGKTGEELREGLLANSRFGINTGMNLDVMDREAKKQEVEKIRAEARQAQDSLLADSYKRLGEATTQLNTSITSSATLMYKAGELYMKSAEAIPSKISWDGSVNVNLVGGSQLLEGLTPLIQDLINKSLEGSVKRKDSTLPPIINDGLVARRNGAGFSKKGL